MSSAAPHGEKLHFKEKSEHQDRQDIYTIKFSAAFNQVISECHLIMENGRVSIKATVKRDKNQIKKSVDPERTI